MADPARRTLIPAARLKADTVNVGLGLMVNIDLAGHTASASPALPR